MRLPAARLWSANMFEWCKEFLVRIIQRFFITGGKRLPAESQRNLDENGNPVPIDATLIPCVSDVSSRRIAAYDGSFPVVNRKLGSLHRSPGSETGRDRSGKDGHPGKDGGQSKGTNGNKASGQSKDRKLKKIENSFKKEAKNCNSKKSSNDVDVVSSSDDKKKSANPAALQTDGRPRKVPSSGKLEILSERRATEEEDLDKIERSSVADDTEVRSLSEENDSSCGGGRLADEDETKNGEKKAICNAAATPRSGRSKKKRKAGQKNGGKPNDASSPVNASSLEYCRPPAASDVIDGKTHLNFFYSKSSCDARNAGDSKESSSTEVESLSLRRVPGKSEQPGNESPTVASSPPVNFSSSAISLRRLPDLLGVSNAKPSAVVHPCRSTIRSALNGGGSVRSTENEEKPVKSGSTGDDDDDDDVKSSFLTSYFKETEIEKIETLDIMSRANVLKSDLNRLSAIRLCDDLIQGSNNDLVRESNNGLVRESNNGLVHGSKKDLVHGSKNDLLRGSNDDFIQGSNNDLIQGSKDNLVQRTKSDLVRGSNEGRNEFFEGGSRERPIKNPPSSLSCAFDVHQNSSAIIKQDEHRPKTRSVELDSVSRTRQSFTTIDSRAVDARLASDCYYGPTKSRKPKTPSTDKARDRFPRQNEHGGERSTPAARKNGDFDATHEPFRWSRNRRGYGYGVLKPTCNRKAIQETVVLSNRLLPSESPPSSDYSERTTVHSSSSSSSLITLNCQSDVFTPSSKTKSYHKTFDFVTTTTESTCHYHHHRVSNDSSGEFDLGRAQRFLHSEFDKVLKSARNGGGSEVTVFRCD